MINKIFWDIDETLIHSIWGANEPPTQPHHVMVGENSLYYVFERECAKELIAYSRHLVGLSNVFILTAASRKYAERVNELCEWQFPAENIISREDIQAHYWSTAYGGKAICAGKHAHPDNVLIDNLCPRENEEKIAIIGINKTYETNYLEHWGFFGVEFENAKFANDVIHFLNERHCANKI